MQNFLDETQRTFDVSCIQRHRVASAGRVSDAPVSWRLTSYPATVIQRVVGIHMLPPG